jgi:hypothetical protein
MFPPKTSTLRASPRRITLKPPRDIRVRFDCTCAATDDVATAGPAHHDPAAAIMTRQAESATPLSFAAESSLPPPQSQAVQIRIE